jgi:hypothetical protein
MAKYVNKWKQILGRKHRHFKIDYADMIIFQKRNLKTAWYFIIINLSCKPISMKRNLLVCVLFSLSFFACNNKKSNNNSGKNSETYREVPVPNVNGNIPDTTNSIDLSTKKDSSVVKDSSSH